MKEILKRLSNADAIAAREKEVRKILREEMKSYADAIQYDHLGSICFEKKGSTCRSLKNTAVKGVFTDACETVAFRIW